ncbi:MAG TPA: hypothetical protein VIY72_09085 [Acidimicrobiales bacterium]
MTAYEITLKEQVREVVEGADAYEQEGPLTTFFRTSSQRRVVDCWSIRLASFRTSEIMVVRRVERDDDALPHALDDPDPDGTVTRLCSA